MLKTVISAWLHQPPTLSLFRPIPPPTLSMLSHRKNLQQPFKRRCQRELQRVLDTSSFSPLQLTWGGAKGATGGGHRDVSQYTFRSICLGNGADKKRVRLFLESCERTCDDVLNDSDRAGLRSA